MAQDSQGRLICADHIVTFDTIHRDARRAASGLNAAGLGRGSTIAIMLRNEAAFFAATLAASMIEAVATAINWHYTGDEASYLLRDSGATVWVVHADIWRRIGADIPDDVLRGLTVLVVETPPGIAQTFGISDAETQVPQGVANWADWLGEHPEWDGPPPHPQAAMIYTSGTTGRPKGVRRLGPVGVNKSGNHNAFVKGAHTLIVAPMYHSAPNRNAMSAFFTGGDIILQPRFDAEEMLALIAAHQITHAFVVPTMFVRLLKTPDAVRARYDVSSLTHVVHADAPCPAEVKGAMIDWWGPVIYEYYGGTETGGVTYCSPHEALAHPGTVGCAVPDATIMVFDENGVECPTGVVGEIFVRLHSYPDFAYQGLPEDRAAIEHKGLITCGDVGYLDAQGYLFLTDRKKDMIISGGVNIYPAQIEAALIQHPVILDCAMFGLPDVDMGERVAAAVQLRPGDDLTLAEVRNFLQDRIADYTIPRDLHVMETLPRDASGKMFKRKLRDIFG